MYKKLGKARRVSGTKFVFRRFDHQHIKTVCRPRVEVVICYRYEDWSRAAPVTKPVRTAATDKQLLPGGRGVGEKLYQDKLSTASELEIWGKAEFFYWMPCQLLFLVSIQ